MDKQNEGILAPSEDGDPGRHERLVTVGGFGKQEGLHKEETKTFYFLYLKSSEMDSMKSLHIQKTLFCRYM